MNVDTVAEAFVKWLEDEGVAVFGNGLYLNQVPDDAPQNTYWITTSGGNPITKLATGEQVKQYFLTVYYRSIEGKDVEKKLFALEEKLNCTSCVNIEPFEIHEISATTYPTDSDLDNIERRVGFLQANIKIYKKEC